MIYLLASLALAFFLWKVISSFWTDSRQGAKAASTGQLQPRCFSQDRDAPTPTGLEPPPFDLPKPQDITGREPEAPLIPRHKEEDDKTVWVGTVHLGGARGGDAAPSLLTLSTPNLMMREDNEVLEVCPQYVSPLKPDPQTLAYPTQETDIGSFPQLVTMETQGRQEGRMTAFVGEHWSSDELELGFQLAKEESALKEELFEHGSGTAEDGSQPSRGEILKECPKASDEELPEICQTTARELIKISSQTAKELPIGNQNLGKERVEGSQTTGKQLIEDGSRPSRKELLVDASQTPGDDIRADVSESAGEELIEGGFLGPSQEPPEGSSPPRKRPAGGIRLFGGTELLNKIQKRRFVLENAELSGAPGGEGIPPNLENITWCVDKEATTDPEEPLTREPPKEDTKGNAYLAGAYVVHGVPTDLSLLDPVSDETTNPQESLGPPWGAVLTEGNPLTHLNKDRPRGPAKRRPSFNTGRT